MVVVVVVVVVGAGVFPVKVCQQRHVVEEIVKFGRKYMYGLEAGSKPELLIVLAFMTTPGALITCNGYKGKIEC